MMYRSRLNPDLLDPQYMLFLLELSVATMTNESRYLRWLSTNRQTLLAEFQHSDEPDPDPLLVECTFGIWARRKFRETVSA
jgi:hypothetical protein